MSTGFTVSQTGSYKADLDDILMRRENLSDGTLWTWGANQYGELGSSAARSSPDTTSGGGTNWKSVEIGYYHTAAIKTDGTLWTWGSGTNGKLGNNDATVSRSSPGTTISGGNDWKSVACGYQHTAAIKIDGSLWTWGLNTSGELGTNNTTARSSPGTTSGGGTNWQSVSFLTYNAVAIKTDGTLWTWGPNASGELGTGNTTARSSPGTTAGGGTTWKTASSGGGYIAAIKTDGTLWTWGSGANGKLGTNNTTARSSPDTTSGGGTNWKSVACGYHHTVAIKTDGTLWTWGLNTSGQLGTNNLTARSSPYTIIGGGTNWKSVVCGDAHTAAIKTDGTLWAWGSNSSGRLGTGDILTRSSPDTIAGGGTNWKSVAAGVYHSAAITDLSF